MSLLRYASFAIWHTLVTLGIAYHSLVRAAEPMLSSLSRGVFYAYLPLPGAQDTHDCAELKLCILALKHL